MTARVCKTCGKPEERRRVGDREVTNISPVDGRCIACLLRAPFVNVPRKDRRQVSPEAEAVKKEQE